MRLLDRLRKALIFLPFFLFVGAAIGGSVNLLCGWDLLWAGHDHSFYFLPAFPEYLLSGGSSGGYPYFIQEWGFQLWNFVQEEPITLADAKCVDVAVTDKLDRSFFRVRMDRLTQAERTMLFALAEMEGPMYKLQDVADHLKMNVRALSPRRSSPIAKGMIYSPGTGLVAFTVPLFAEYLKQAGRADVG